MQMSDYHYYQYPTPPSPTPKRGRRIALIVALASVVAIGVGVGGAALVMSDDRSSSTSASESSEDAEAEAAAAEAAEEARAVAQKCRRQVDGLLRALKEIDSRLDVGLAYDEYSGYVGDASVAYDMIPFERMSTDCVHEVGVPLENAINAYITASNEWDDCVWDDWCDPEHDIPLQRRWLRASTQIDDAETGLSNLSDPSLPSNSGTTT
jgi:hypothetical protein